MILKALLVQLLFLCSPSSSLKSCCKGDAFLVSGNCSDGLKPLLDCKKYLLKEDRGVVLLVDDFENLIITNELKSTSYMVENGSYCMSKYANRKIKAALICTYEADEPFWEMRIACAIISIFFAMLVLLIYILVPSLRDLQGKCTMHAVANLTMAYVFLTITQLGYYENMLCEVLGFNIYFFFLAAFFWLNVTCFHVWRSSVHPSIILTSKKLYLLSVAYGYGIPLTLIIIAIICHNVPGTHIKPGIGYGSCFFTGDKATWTYFYIPLTYVLLSNVIMFCWTAVVLWKTVGNSCRQTQRLKVLRARCSLYMKLFVIMGQTWIFEILSYIFKESQGFTKFVWIFFDYVNILQGVFIFLVLILFRKRALKGIAEKGCCKRFQNVIDEESENTDIFCSKGDELKELSGNNTNMQHKEADEP